VPRLPIGEPPSGPLAYFRCDWAHRPSEDPVAIYYEVDQLGRVSRLIDVFAGGGKDRSAVADFGGRESELPGAASLVEGSFHESAANLIAGHVVTRDDERLSLTPISADEFEAEWRAAAPPRRQPGSIPT